MIQVTISKHFFCLNKVVTPVEIKCNWNLPFKEGTDYNLPDLLKDTKKKNMWMQSDLW